MMCTRHNTNTTTYDSHTIRLITLFLICVEACGAVVFWQPWFLIDKHPDQLVGGSASSTGHYTDNTHRSPLPPACVLKLLALPDVVAGALAVGVALAIAAAVVGVAVAVVVVCLRERHKTTR